MRTFVSTALVLSLAAAGVPCSLVAAQPQVSPRGGMVSGIAHQTNLQPLANARVQIRNVNTGSLSAATTSAAGGEFSFSSVQPGTYVLEIVDAHGRIVGMSPPYAVAEGAVLSVSVVAVAAGAATSGDSAGFSILGLGPLTSLVVLGAAGAAGVTAVVATRDDASPSK